MNREHVWTTRTQSRNDSGTLERKKEIRGPMVTQGSRRYTVRSETVDEVPLGVTPRTISGNTEIRHPCYVGGGTGSWMSGLTDPDGEWLGKRG